MTQIEKCMEDKIHIILASVNYIGVVLYCSLPFCTLDKLSNS